MHVRDAMNTSVRTVTPDTKILEVASLMTLYRYQGLPVIDAGDALVGVIAERDLLHSLFPKLESLMAEGMHSVDYDKEMARYKEILGLKVADLMTPNPVTVDPEMHVLRAATIMVRHNFRRIPVAEGSKLVGMLSLGDVHKAIFHSNLAQGLSV
ncbi:signal transduction protein [Thiohalocapsa halophila]|jgi:CBS domain-containing protein|uniref:Signal transduction protein n=1 Tax=Thiohalocapsa halophila TaxID=69359 RepID=A0ABS1CNS6_9GAMM|nr:CBS domain-containing protein [Thiohalocapsa halophila]MBK1633576.1 signal transduction protein [Thiohalocapsa halophila]NBC12954.1 CBS domain-containing protein [Gammaproteobacteria bacterium]